ncbi:HNH endonuclease [Rhodococcus pyridinivorans]
MHINGNHADNKLENLRWGSRRDNVLDMVTHGVHNHARKTHCKNGHPFDAENTYIAPSTGQRCCRTCRSERSRRRYLERMSRP